MNAAGGYELDRYDSELGTPANTISIATAWGFSNSYQHCVEELYSTDPKQGGQDSEEVRSDIVYIPGPNNGGLSAVSFLWPMGGDTSGDRAQLPGPVGRPGEGVAPPR